MLYIRRVVTGIIRKAPRFDVLAVVLLATIAAPHAASTDRIVSFDDAFVDADYASNRWTIGNDRITYSLRVSRNGTLVFDGMRVADSDDVFTVGSEPDALATLEGDVFRLGATGTPFEVDRVDASAGSHFIALSLRFTSDAYHIVATRHYVMYPHAAAVEMWTEFETTNSDPQVIENLNAYALTVPHGPIDWTSGLDISAEEGGSFTRRSRQLHDGERMNMGATAVSSESAVPYISIGNGHRRFLSGLIWSGAWSLLLERRGGAIDVELGLPVMSALAHPGRRVEGPHAFVGVVFDQPGADITAVTRFVEASRAGRGFPAATTFNTWFVHGTHIDEDLIKLDIDYASQIGVELFQLDAGWYRGADVDAPFEFTRGLGSWAVDEERFPSGLAALRDYAHEHGMQFGIWVEPERVDLATVGKEGLAEERFLAQQDDEYQPGVPNEEARDGQICLADPAARAWVLARLTQFIDEVGPDNVKWDFNRWVLCTRVGHGHPVNGGNFEHTRGLYDILAALRQRYPALSIENCSGGGHRLDFAMARLTDAAWMDDRTAPSSHVRYGLDGLSFAFPAQYLFSYVMAHPDEPIHGTLDMARLVRSRMPGVVGLAADLPMLSELELNELQQQIALARQLRPIQAGAVTHALTPQTRDYGVWNVVQQALPSTGGSLIFAFSNGAHDPMRVFLRDVKADVTYELRSADRGRLGLLRGADLIAGGLEIEEAPESWAQVLVLEPSASRISRKP